jgi:hypothetical protein
VQHRAHLHHISQKPLGVRAPHHFLHRQRRFLHCLEAKDFKPLVCARSVQHHRLPKRELHIFFLPLQLRHQRFTDLLRVLLVLMHPC